MKIGEIYCMNLFDFLENWHPNTLIIVEAEDNIIFEGTVKDIPLEISCKYWVQEGTVRKDGEKVVIPVEYEAEINRRIEEQNSISFSDILSNILSIIDSHDYLKETFESMVRSAHSYTYYRKNWNRFSIETLGCCNKERTINHDSFIEAINSLSRLIEEESISGLVPWRVALGNDRKIIGDFAEYIIDRLEKAKERIEILESIKWAQEHQNQVYYIVEHALDSIDAKIQIMQQFKFSENQAQAIIDMRVRAFSVDEREKIANELQEIFEWIKHFPEL
ncbi:DNA gyrase subunit A [[Ruminococcus] torques]|mgnify:FL=1|uniref:DNA gyrase subunit A n=1 Tax=[Ruminococcus] torques TaxID=33039 RepID=UPI0003162527|nr:DNA gyrase subunit A [[Ruminococcus] torques]